MSTLVVTLLCFIDLTTITGSPLRWFCFVLIRKCISARIPTDCRVVLRRVVSSIIGLVGGLVDLWAGSSILLNSSNGMGPMAGSGQLLGYSLVVFGVIVLLTGLLMIVYGSVMIVLGAGMIGGFFNVMMQWSALSGIVMIALGLAMHYSGWDMSRKRM